jgi:anhydro-N-acetylmuramic acid kinase
MTGTSCDGLDASCVEISSDGWGSVWEKSVEYPLKLRKEVLEFQNPKTAHTAENWLNLHRKLGEWYGSVLGKMIRGQKRPPDVIANHGQTVAHFPGKSGGGMTLQLGDGTRIAVATGLTVVNQFREGDLAAGGQGAPLVPLFHRIIASEIVGLDQGVAIHNLGGISNLTYLGPRGQTIAFDTGPGNIWIDASVNLMTKGKSLFDRDGKIATRGEVDQTAVQKILKHPYFSKPIPKSTGRDDFPFEFFFSRTSVKDQDLVATATQVTAESIARSYEMFIIKKRLPLKLILFCGGGAKNPTLLKEVQKLLPRVQISTLCNYGLDSQYIEAQAFALYGYLSLLGHPIGGTWTGAKGYAPPGQIIPGKNWQLVMDQVHSILSSLIS